MNFEDLNKGDIFRMMHQPTGMRYATIAISKVRKLPDRNGNWYHVVSGFIPNITYTSVGNDEFLGMVEGLELYQFREKHADNPLNIKLGSIVECKAYNTSRHSQVGKVIGVQSEGLVPVYSVKFFPRKDKVHYTYVTPPQISRVLTPEELTHYLLCN